MSELKKLLLIPFLFSGVAHAGTISVPAFSADSGVAHLELLRTTAVNVVNGNISGSAGTGSQINIKADSVAETDMYDDANPRVFMNEVLDIGVDTTSASNALVTSGLTPADSAGLTSDISAGTAYINGYRVNKSATSKTYSPSKDTYVDLDQNGNFTLQEVTVGASAPSVAANSARLAKVTTDGTEITVVTDLANRRLTSLIIPTNYRVDMNVSRDSGTTIKVFPGSIEIDEAMINTTVATTLTLGTAGNWAGGSSLAAANTYGFVGVDTAGNIKMHTTAPTHDNYALTTTAGRKRYASWSATVYRIIGWFYMDAGTQIANASNIKDMGVTNIVYSQDTGIASLTSTTTEISKIFFFNSGNIVTVHGVLSMDSGTTDQVEINFRRGSTTIPGSGNRGSSNNAGQPATATAVYVDTTAPQGTTSYSIMANSAATINMRKRGLVIQEN